MTRWLEVDAGRSSGGACLWIVPRVARPGERRGAVSPGHGALRPSQGLGGFETDGVRFALIYDRGSYEAPLVLDTFRARRFRPGPPLPACETSGVPGAGLLLWSCPGPSGWRPMISELATETVREPVGWDTVEAMEDEHYRCNAGGIGRRWLMVWCSYGIGPTSVFYLNHRTGTLEEEIYPGVTAYKWFPNLDLPDLGRNVCAPLGRGNPLDDYVPPFALESSVEGVLYSEMLDQLRLRRCGSRRAES